jgi:hypothetical protein
LAKQWRMDKMFNLLIKLFIYIIKIVGKAWIYSKFSWLKWLMLAKRVVLPVLKVLLR